MLSPLGPRWPDSTFSYKKFFLRSFWILFLINKISFLLMLNWLDLWVYLHQQLGLFYSWCFWYKLVGLYALKPSWKVFIMKSLKGSPGQGVANPQVPEDHSYGWKLLYKRQELVIELVPYSPCLYLLDELPSVFLLLLLGAIMKFR